MTHVRLFSFESSFTAKMLTLDIFYCFSTKLSSDHGKIWDDVEIVQSDHPNNILILFIVSVIQTWCFSDTM